MARPIKETPTLYGKDAKKFAAEIEHPKPVSQAEIEHAEAIYKSVIENASDFLEANQSDTPSVWREQAEWRRDNWAWLQHSEKIAVKVLLQMKQLGLTQQALAERMDCTQQYVSKILKGKENMSLETLSKLEDALGICLISDDNDYYKNSVTKDK